MQPIVPITLASILVLVNGIPMDVDRPAEASPNGVVLPPGPSFEPFNIVDVMHRFKRSTDDEDERYLLMPRSLILLATTYVSDSIRNFAEEIRTQIDVIASTVTTNLRALRRPEGGADVFESVANTAINYALEYLTSIVHKLQAQINVYIDALLDGRAVGDDEGETNVEAPRARTFDFLGGITTRINRLLTGLVKTVVTTANAITFNLFAQQVQFVEMLITGLINKLFPVTL